MNVYGYSERGVLNSLLYEILYSNHGDALLSRLITRALFPLTDNKPSPGAATVFVEQSLSQFGDADAIILMSSNAANCAIFVEAKVQPSRPHGRRRRTRMPERLLISDQFDKFEAGVKRKSQTDKFFSSNIFTQLYHKQRLVSALKSNGIEALQQGIEFPSWSFRTESSRQKRKIGKNSVVLRAVKRIQQHVENVFYLALVPDTDIRAADFFANRLRNVQLPTVPEWDPSFYGYLTWATVKSFCEQNHLAATLDVFAYNDGQIFRERVD